MGNKFSFLEQTEDAKQLTVKKQPKQAARKERAVKPKASLEVLRGAEERRPAGRPRTGKRSNPEYRSLTILVRRDMHKTMKEVLRKDPEGLDISGLFERLCGEWIEGRGSKRLKAAG